MKLLFVYVPAHPDNKSQLRNNDTKGERDRNDATQERGLSFVEV